MRITSNYKKSYEKEYDFDIVLYVKDQYEKCFNLFLLLSTTFYSFSFITIIFDFILTKLNSKLYSHFLTFSVLNIGLIFNFLGIISIIFHIIFPLYYCARFNASKYYWFDKKDMSQKNEVIKTIRKTCFYYMLFYFFDFLFFFYLSTNLSSLHF